MALSWNLSFWPWAWCTTKRNVRSFQHRLLIFHVFAGKIVTIETVSVPIINGNVDATGTRWIESANDDAPYAFILRLFTVQDTSAKETLGTVHAFTSLSLQKYRFSKKNNPDFRMISPHQNLSGRCGRRPSMHPYVVNVLRIFFARSGFSFKNM